MNLLCPSCQKMLQVPDQYAGQQMRCPMCNNVFSVPALPPGGAPPPPMMDVGAPPPMPGGLPPIEAPRRAPAPPVPMGDYMRKRAIRLNPKIVAIVGAGLLLFALIFSFLPWLSVSGGDPRSGKEISISWNAWGVAFGSSEASESNPYPIPKETKNVMYGLFAIFLIPAFLWAVFSMLVELGIIPVGPGFAKIRGIIAVSLVGLAFLFLFIARLSAAFSSAGRSSWNLSAWGHISYTFTFWALLIALLEMWSQLRGPGRPPLKVEFHS